MRPRAWPGFDLELREGHTRWQIGVSNPRGVGRGVVQERVDGVEVGEPFVPRVDDGRAHRVQIVLGGTPRRPGA